MAIKKVQLNSFMRNIVKTGSEVHHKLKGTLGGKRGTWSIKPVVTNRVTTNNRVSRNIRYNVSFKQIAVGANNGRLFNVTRGVGVNYIEIPTVAVPFIEGGNRRMRAATSESSGNTNNANPAARGLTSIAYNRTKIHVPII